MQDDTYDLKNDNGNHSPTGKVEIDIDQDRKQIECLDLTMGNSPHKVNLNKKINFAYLFLYLIFPNLRHEMNRP